MKKLFLTAGLLFSTLAFIGCGDDDAPVIDQNPDPDPNANTVLRGQITENLTLTSDKIWTLDGRVTVIAGTTLTIEAGTIIKANAGQGANASALLVARDGDIVANGTASQPIIFTSSADNIQVGTTAGTNLDQNDRGLWGGVLILGKAPISADGNVESLQIEGIPASDTNGLYGGSDSTDSSGTFRYVSIRHGGANIGEGNEINGLTLGGVGNGTEISYIEVVANVDDGIEFFGGTVNVSNCFVWACGDDQFDIDQAYSGTIDNAMAVLGDVSDHGLEIDGPEGSLEASFTLQNVTLVGNTVTNNGEYADYRSGALGATKNVLAYGFKPGSDIELDNNGVSQNFLDGDLTFEAWQIVLPEGVASANSLFVEKVGCAQNCDDDNDDNDVDEDPIILDPTFTERAAMWASSVASPDVATVGADTSQFAWTYSNQKANLGF